MSIDITYINYGLSEGAWAILQKHYFNHLTNHPICEICNYNDSVRIAPVGTVKAICNICLKTIYKNIEESVERQNNEENMG